ncbi:unnamed protein product [Acanthoscelides obtectus]|uniref:Ig-like domain-containing protein n=1 Tax=Acanthoscelides obtectus TaxID=200917 RepID=A0A9P0PEZ9_ACAOB|nr:unnamed protein product [Acanthoscelides obtectus]CAK1657294.1 Protein amalgam [Acanthoscelides obtectus]
MNMEVKLLVLVLCFCGIVSEGYTKRVKSKPENLEDTYGELVEDSSRAAHLEETDVQNDDFDEYGIDVPDEPEDNSGGTGSQDVPVKIISKPMEFIARIGDTVLLPCEVDNPDGVTIWQKDANRILYQSHVRLTDRSNLAEYANNTLEVRVMSDDDFGQYDCKIIQAKSNSDVLSHRIVREAPPVILEIKTRENKTVFKEGDTATLVCNATGHPTPEVMWYRGREGERLGIKGQMLTIPNLTFKNGGLYRCLADNKVGKAAHAHIEVFVEHKPVVNIEKYMVNTANEHEAELKCTVKAYPAPEVLWQRNGKNIDVHTPRVKLRSKKNEYIENILVITNVQEEDFGQYTCYAKNSLGKVEKVVSLVKTPAIQEFVKPEKPNKDVVLTWKVESKAPVSKHELQYRRRGDSEWQTIEPEVAKEGEQKYVVKYTLKGLDAGNYETRLRSKNEHGWSDYSQVMPFEGVLAKHGSTHKSHKKHHHKEKDQKDLRASQSGSEISRISAILFSISLLFLFRMQ